MLETDLSKYNNDWFDEGAGILKRTCWYFTNVLFFMNPLNPISSIKVRLLRIFGAKIGKGVVIKPCVNIKYPWKLSIDDYTWIGEKVWIDNLDFVSIGKNCCLSQEVMLLCGNHNYKSVLFDLIVQPITLEDGVWLGARSTVAGGVTCRTHAVLAACSFVTKELAAYTIYRGNPCKETGKRTIN